jgi:hypothetical protein
MDINIKVSGSITLEAGNSLLSALATAGWGPNKSTASEPTTKEDEDPKPAKKEKTAARPVKKEVVEDDEDNKNLDDEEEADEKPAPKPAKKGGTKADLPAIRALVKEKREDYKDEIKALLKDYKVTSLGDLDEEDYGAFFDAVNAL